MMRPPSIDRLARSISHLGLPHPLAVSRARMAVSGGQPDQVESLAQDLKGRMYTDVINATGTILHTNLARSPLEPAPRPNLGFRASNVELDLMSGARSDRNAIFTDLFEPLVGCQAAAVVNNGAAALLLVLSNLASSNKVIVSRGELVEIGGGFRVPEVIQSSGCQLIEVGTTNRTRLADYKKALDSHPEAVILKVHPSNYTVEGFTTSTSISELVELNRPIVYDVGSGLLDGLTPWLKSPIDALSKEPGVKQALAEGASVVTFSADKLMGGPQAGIIASSDQIVSACVRHPLYRALRPGSQIIEPLTRTLIHYLNRTASTEIPLWRMISATTESLHLRARQIGIGTEIETKALIGAGSAPGTYLESVGLRVDGDIRKELRRREIPIMARTVQNHTVLDLRSFAPEDDPVVAQALTELLCNSTD